jgi:hypothetical protein
MILRKRIGQLVDRAAIQVKCPNCAKVSTFLTPQPHIDTCGFKSYTFICDYCSSSLSGVVDPFDDRLLISLLDPQINGERLTGESHLSIRSKSCPTLD